MNERPGDAGCSNRKREEKTDGNNRPVETVATETESVRFDYEEMMSRLHDELTATGDYTEEEIRDVLEAVASKCLKSPKPWMVGSLSER